MKQMKAKDIISYQNILKERLEFVINLPIKNGALLHLVNQVKKISLASNGHIMNWQEMYWISKYAIEHSYEDWFDEDIIEVDGIKLTREQAEKVYQKLTAERTYDIK